MRIAHGVFCALLIAVVPSVAGAQGGKNRRPNPAQAREDAKAQTVDQVAEQAFKQADRNHNQVLSRTEYKTADELLQNGIQTLAQQGVLGQPQRPQGQGRQGQNKMQPPNGAAVFGAPPVANKNRITLTEFKAYAHTLAQEADAAWAQARAANQGPGRGPMGRGRPMQGPNMPQQPPAR